MSELAAEADSSGADYVFDLILQAEGRATMIGAAGAAATRAASAEAKGSAARPVGGNLSPPGRYDSAVAVKPARATGPASGCGQGNPAAWSRRWTSKQPASRAAMGRILTTTSRRSSKRRPTTSER